MAHFPPIEDQLEILQRGAVDLVEETQLADKLRRAESTGTPLTVKVGFDPTSPDLHLGHTVLLRKMKHFQDLGHRVIFLIGDFTAMIGDPTGKKATRPQLSREEIEANSGTYKTQVFHLLDPEKTVVDYNTRWLNELGSAGMIRLAGQYTLARMLERDDFRKRLKNNQPISIHELLYPLAQGYDSIFLEADVELGGHDQLLNLLVGRHLMKECDLEPQIVLTVPLLVGTDGVEKMSKSLGNSIGLEDPPGEIYGKAMSIPDDLMWNWYLLLTELPEVEIEDRKKAVAAGELHPKTAKMELARRLVEDFHDAAAAKAADEEFEKIFSGRGTPQEMPLFEHSGTEGLIQLLAADGLVSSKSEGRRMVQQGAVSVDGEKVSDFSAELVPRAEEYVVKVGKRRFARVKIGTAD
jgi:tyrosyl-tRNA synthetase